MLGLLAEKEDDKRENQAETDCECERNDGHGMKGVASRDYSAAVRTRSAFIAQDGSKLATERLHRL
jgi:hypothetical protein